MQVGNEDKIALSGSHYSIFQHGLKYILEVCETS